MGGGQDGPTLLVYHEPHWYKYFCYIIYNISFMNSSYDFIVYNILFYYQGLVNQSV